MRLWLGLIALLSASDAWASPNSPLPYGSGYSSWGTQGGSTLGHGNGARANLFFSNRVNGDGYGWAGVEGYYIVGFDADVNLAIGGRLPFYPFGLSPGLELKWRLIADKPFQLAFNFAAFVPIVFAGYDTLTVSLTLEPGVLMSVFIRDNMELYFGPILSFAPFVAPAPVFQVGLVHRLGFAYTLKSKNLGFFGHFEFGPGYYVPGTVHTGALRSTFIFTGAFQAGAQFRF